MRETSPFRQENGKIVNIPNISYIETTFPYKEGNPNQELIVKYDLLKLDFPILSGESRVDMILGAQKIKKFKSLMKKRICMSFPHWRSPIRTYILGSGGQQLRGG